MTGQPKARDTTQEESAQLFQIAAQMNLMFAGLNVNPNLAANAALFVAAQLMTFSPHVTVEHDEIAVMVFRAMLTKARTINSDRKQKMQ